MTDDPLLHENDKFVVSNKHLRLLNNIFRNHHQLSNLPELKAQILDWLQIVLSDERKEWAESRANSVNILCRLDRKKEARNRAAAKNKRYEPFKAAFKQLQEIKFREAQKAGKILSANAFVKWFLSNKPSLADIPYIESNRQNKLRQLAQANNREFKKLLNAEVTTPLTVDD